MTGRSASLRDALYQLDAIGSRQHQVQQDQLQACAWSTRSDQLPWVAGHDRGVAGRDECVPHVAQRLRVVVDHQDTRSAPALPLGEAGAARDHAGRGPADGLLRPPESRT